MMICSDPMNAPQKEKAGDHPASQSARPLSPGHGFNEAHRVSRKLDSVKNLLLESIGY